MIKNIKKGNYLKLIFNSSFLYPIIISPFLLFLYKIYLRKVSAFGCFDDCFNIVAGFFLLDGKTLYKDLFFNHQPLMAYISYSIQNVTDPINILALILAHRKFILIFSILMNLLIAFRFKLAGVGFVLLYEFTKFYVFGDRFLAEAIIVYPFVYMLGLTFLKFNNEKIYGFEYFLSAFFTWFIVFLREPFVPLAVLLFIIIIGFKLTKIKMISILFFISLCLFILLKLPLNDYAFNVFYINKSAGDNFYGLDILKIFFYPVYIFFSGKEGFFRNILISLSTIYLILIFIVLFKTKNRKLIGFIVLILGFANIRYVTPGQAFYEAFHMAPWYGMFVFSIFMLFGLSWLKRIKYLLFIIVSGVFIYMVFPGNSFIWENTDRHTEFINNYGNYLSYGEAIRILSLPGNTLFVDGFDELIHWQSKTPSSYKYSWYTSLMPYLALYSDARLNMFKTNPPDIYYGSCPKEISPKKLLPREVKNNYRNIYSFGKPSCLHLKKENIESISNKQREKLKEFGFTIN